VTTRLQRKWLDVGIDRYPVERPDLLERLKVFGDVRRPSRFHLGPDVLPVVDVTPFTEQVPSLLSRFQVGAVAANFATVCLQNTSAIFGSRRVNSRPAYLTIASATAGSVRIGLQPTPFAAIAQAIVGFTDSRRGGSAVLGVDRGCIFGGVAQLTVLPAPQVIISVPAANTTVFVPDQLLKLIFGAPGIDLVVQHNTVNTDLDVSIAWFEEPVAGVTRILQ